MSEAKNPVEAVNEIVEDLDKLIIKEGPERDVYHGMDVRLEISKDSTIDAISRFEDELKERSWAFTPEDNYIYSINVWGYSFD